MQSNSDESIPVLIELDLPEPQIKLERSDNAHGRFRPTEVTKLALLSSDLIQDAATLLENIFGKQPRWIGAAYVLLLKQIRVKLGV